MKRAIAVTWALTLALTGSHAQLSTNVNEYGDEDLCNTGTYPTDPKASATLAGLAPNAVTYATHSYGHSFPFSPAPADYLGTDQIYVGHVQTGGYDGYSSAASRTNGPQVITLDYSSLVPTNQAILTFTLGIGADDFQYPAWGNPFTASINGATNSALTAALSGLNQTGPYEQFLTIGIDPAVLKPDGTLTLSIDEGGNGGDGWAIDFLTVGITSTPSLGRLGGSSGTNETGDKVFVVSLPPNTTGAVLESTTNLGATPVIWTPVWTNSGETNIPFSISIPQRFFRLRE